MKLSELLEEEAHNQGIKYPSFINRYFRKEIARIKENELIKRASTIGDTVPDGVFLDQNNKEVVLSDLKEDKPAIIIFYRGSWCPYCNLELRAYNQILEDSGPGNVNLFAISPEAPDISLNIDDLHFSVLSDRDNQFAKKLNLVYKPSKLLLFLYRLGGINLQKNQLNRNTELPVPATYVVDERGIISYAFVDPDYKKRAEPSLVLDEYKKLLH